MPRIGVPDGRDPPLHLWGGTGNELTGPAAAFSDDELVQLGLCVGSWLAFGRLNRVFGVDGSCRVPLAPHGPDRLHQVPHV